MPDRPALVPLANSTQRALDELSKFTRTSALTTLSASQLMGERALLSGLTPAHGRSPGGTCRLLRAADHPLAINLPRAEDWELLPAWLELADGPGNWSELARALRHRPAQGLVVRARTLGLAAAVAGRGELPSLLPSFLPGPETPTGFAPRRQRLQRNPRVVDLSSLWAGPLCTHLLQHCGADVIKVESTRRPDGARYGSRDFYDLLNAHKRSVALDLSQPAGQRTLNALLAYADIVVESARPRALSQMGIDVDATLSAAEHLTWIRITGYGCVGPGADWIAFGDDAGVAAGLGDVMRRATGYCQFAGDAIADPITGIRAALTAWKSWLAGGSRLLSFPLAQTAARTLEEEQQLLGTNRLLGAFRDWWRQALSADPWPGVGARGVHERAQALGADTASVLAELGISC